ncbi:type II toxin-antitoxin system HicA family toxin [Paraflavitalea pollutisoli]|uniref:type II toxin-antitoxin system HicA family toxin n=1 Tax=Paraflavitalea pollutisoli TaxID=3034143 RepID=UPI003B837D8B
MTFKQVVKRLRDAGWRIKNQEGGHVHMTHEKIPGKVTIPRHGKKDLKPGTLSAIAKHARLKF